MMRQWINETVRLVEVAHATSVAQVVTFVPTRGGFRLKWSAGPHKGQFLDLTNWQYFTLKDVPIGAHDDGKSLVFVSKDAALAAAHEVANHREDEFGIEPSSRQIATQPTRTFYHVTEHEHATEIMQNGFIGGWGDVGFGVYFYGTLYSANDYAAEGGWDNELENPVILAVNDPAIEKIVDLDPSWDAERYADMYWHPMDPDTDRSWKPAKVEIIG
jgi:hypothetical protein